MMNFLTELMNQLHPDVDFTVEKHLVDDGILDSFDIVTIVAEVDGELGITIPVEELTAENFNSLPSLLKLLKRLED